MAKSNISGYDITKNPVAPNLLLEWEGGDIAVYTPVLTAVEGGYQLSWTNDAGLDNPDPVTILNGQNGSDGQDGTDGTDGSNGVTFTPTVTQITGGYRLSWSNDGSLPNPQSVDIMNGDADDGATFTPVVSEVSGGYQLSWTNDKGLPNPNPVTIHNGTDGSDGTDGTDGSDGVTFTSVVTAITGGYQLSWTNDGGAQNPQSVNIMNGTDGTSPSVVVTRVSNGVQISVTDGTGTTSQTVYDGNDGQSGSNGVTFTPVVTAITGGYQLSWTNDGSLPNPQSVNIMNGQDGSAGVGVPSGGSTGQVLSKASSSDYDTQWVTPSGGGSEHGIPAGGFAGQVLTKQSSDNYDAEWDYAKGGFDIHNANIIQAFLYASNNNINDDISLYWEFDAHSYLISIRGVVNADDNGDPLAEIGFGASMICLSSQDATWPGETIPLFFGVPTFDPSQHKIDHTSVALTFWDMNGSSNGVNGKLIYDTSGSTPKLHLTITGLSNTAEEAYFDVYGIPLD